MTFRPTVWLPEFLVNAGNTTGTQFEPQITALSNGNFVVVWTDTFNNVDSSAGLDIIAQIYSPLGLPIGSPFRANSNHTADNEREPRVAALSNGGFVVVYRDDPEGTGLQNAARFSMFDAAGVVTAQGTIAGPDRQALVMEVTSLPNGGFVVAYREATSVLAGGQESVVDTYTSTGVLLGRELDRDIFIGELATLRSGTVMVATSRAETPLLFQSSLVSAFSITANGSIDTLSAFGASITAPSGVAFFDPQIATLAPSAANNSNSRYVLTWVSDSGNNNDIKFAVFDGGVQKVAETFATSDLEANEEPDVVGLLDGGFFIVWKDVTNSRIEGQRYNADGTMAGSQIVIDTGTVSEPELSLTTDGRILVTWNDNGNIKSSILDPRTNVINGTNGNDVLVAPTEASTMSGLLGNDTLFGSAFADQMDGGANNDSLSGLGGNDTLRGGSGVDRLKGGSDNDTLIGGSSADLLDGGAGIDTADYGTSPTAIVVNLLTNSAAGGDASGDTFNSIERVFGTNTNDTIIGDDNNNELRGGNGIDTLSGNGGTDILLGEAGNDRLVGGIGADVLNGGSEIDRAEYTASLSGVVVDLVSGTGSGGDAEGDTLLGIENVLGSALADTLLGNDVANDLFGADDIDILLGGGGSDRLFGGNGDDILVGGDGADALDGGEGIDIADYGDSEVLVIVDLQAGIGSGGQAQGDTLQGVENVAGSGLSDELLGNALANKLLGGEGDDILDGRGGDDQMLGGGDNDLLLGGQGADFMNGGSGIDEVSYFASLAAVTVNLAGTGSGGDAAGDTYAGIEIVFGSILADEINGAALAESLFGASGNDIIRGGAGVDRLFGLDDDDTLVGQGGRDVIDGGFGNDRLTGSAGGDIFVFESGGGTDRINDFNALDASEKIDLSAVAGITSFADLAANHMVQSGVNVVITDGAGDSFMRIVLANVSLVNLDATNFIF